jgi:Mlc titration factor MtfA (ptsG expression regulator)
LRTGRTRSRWFEGALGGLAAVAAAVVGGSIGGALGAGVGGGLALATAVWVTRAYARRDARRRAALLAPFPAAWRQLLDRRYGYFSRLPEALRLRFEDDLRLFLALKRITGVELDVTDELRLLVAASAVTLSLAWPDYEWSPLTEVLLYPHDFDRDYGYGGELSGQAHSWGTVILSVPALHQSFDAGRGAYHVGLHEFAHLLDLDQLRFDGVPAGMSSLDSAAWLALVEREMARLRAGDSMLDPYAGESPAEFLAVSVEAFFQTPLVLRRHHAELYGLLSGYFVQDPAAWDDRVKRAAH